MFTDTSILTYEIKLKNVFEDFFKHKHFFDFSEHRPALFDKTNKKVPGKMKDEFKGIPINKFIGLNHKCTVHFLMMIQMLTQPKE